VRLNGLPLAQRASASAFAAASSGWFNAGANLIIAKSTPLDVYDSVKSFSFELRALRPTASVNFVCDRGFTSPGESIYVAGSIAALGSWDPAKAVKLDPNIYYDYIDGVNPPLNHNGPGPSAPVWSSLSLDGRGNRQKGPSPILGWVRAGRG
jgi:alpha-glucosidase